jgi:hypothetical protein
MGEGCTFSICPLIVDESQNDEWKEIKFRNVAMLGGSLERPVFVLRPPASFHQHHHHHHHHHHPLLLMDSFFAFLSFFRWCPPLWKLVSSSSILTLRSTTHVLLFLASNSALKSFLAGGVGGTQAGTFVK